MPSVTLKHYTPLSIAMEAGLCCTANLDKAKDKDPEDFILRLIRKGHESVIEHINYTFYITDISRGLLLELERHRHCSMSVESTRWGLKKVVDKCGAIPTGLHDAYWKVFPRSQAQETLLLQAHNQAYALMDTVVEMTKAGIPNDNIKPYLVESVLTNLYFTTNARELRHMLILRSQPNVYEEFRTLVAEIKKALPYDHLFMYTTQYIGE